jgi:hypothetical protein
MYKREIKKEKIKLSLNIFMWQSSRGRVSREVFFGDGDPAFPESLDPDTDCDA